MSQPDKSHLQKLRLLANSKDEFLDTAYKYLVSVLEQDNHALVSLKTGTCNEIHTYCAECPFEFTIEEIKHGEIRIEWGGNYRCSDYTAKPKETMIYL